MLKKYKREGMKQDTSQPVRVPTVTVCFTGLRFNVSACMQYLRGRERVELFYSGEGKGFGVKLLPTLIKTEDSFEIKRYYQHGKVYTARVYCTAFIKKLRVISGIDQRDKIFPLKLDKEKKVLMVEFDARYV